MRIIIICCLLIVSPAWALTPIEFSDNALIGITLSANNINRLSIDNDTIQEIVFPAGSMQTQRAQDNSVYVSQLSNKPFTCFITTGKGHHVVLAINARLGVGKTLVFRANEKKVMTAQSHLKYLSQLSDSIAEVQPPTTQSKPLSSHTLGRGLTATVLEQKTTNQATIERVLLHNHTSKDMAIHHGLRERFQADSLRAESTIIPAKGQLTVVLVKEKTHG